MFVGQVLCEEKGKWFYCKALRQFRCTFDDVELINNVEDDIVYYITEEGGVKNEIARNIETNGDLIANVLLDLVSLKRKFKGD